MKYSSYDLFGGVEFDNGPDPQQWKVCYPQPTPTLCNHCYCISVVVHGRPHGKCHKCGDTMMRQHITWEAK